MASFTPLFGLHFLLAALFARIIGGNILAALLATFFGNPLTFPVIVEVSVQLGNWILGQGGGMHFPHVMAAFGFATAELWHNFTQVIAGEEANWFRLRLFYFRVFLPYLLGGIVPGLVASVVMYYVTLPLVRAYQTRRRKKLRERFVRSRRGAAAMIAKADEAEVDGDGKDGGTDQG